MFDRDGVKETMRDWELNMDAETTTEVLGDKLGAMVSTGVTESDADVDGIDESVGNAV